MVDHHGDFYDLPRLEMNPPLSEPVPVVVGGTSDAALRRAARHDGWVSDLASTTELADFGRRIDGYRAEYGRSDQPFSFIGSATDAVDVDGYRQLEAVGVTDLLTMPWVFYDGFTDDLDAKIAGVHHFAHDIIAEMA